MICTCALYYKRFSVFFISEYCEVQKLIKFKYKIIRLKIRIKKTIKMFMILVSESKICGHIKTDTERMLII